MIESTFKSKYFSLCTTILLVTISLSIPTFGQKMTPELIVQANFDAYNQRDITKFMLYIDKDIKMYNFSDNTLILEGWEACKTTYSDLFDQSPNLHSTIIKRIVIGNQVIDHEHIRGRKEASGITELVLIYEIRNQLIKKITVLRK